MNKLRNIGNTPVSKRITAFEAWKKSADALHP
jgi:hypothetical protein